METVAVRELAYAPHQIRTFGSGECVVLSLVPAARLEVYDEDLSSVWTKSLDGALGLAAAPDGRIWLLDRAGATSIGPRGTIDRVDAPPVPNMEPAALGFVGSDLIFAYQHTAGTPPRLPVLTRISATGTSNWTSAVAAESGIPKLPPLTSRSSWVCGYLQAGDLTISGDAVLAVYRDIRTGLAAGYAFSLTDGRLKYATPLRCIREVAAIGGGRFLVGLQGGGAFATLEYDRDGRPTRRWNSHGRYVVRGGDIRVVELENVALSRSRLARLNADGSVERGDLLEGFQTSEVWVDADNTLYFARDALLIAARELRIDSRQLLCDLRWRGSVEHCLAAGPAGLLVTYSAAIGATGHVSGLHRLTPVDS